MWGSVPVESSVCGSGRRRARLPAARRRELEWWTRGQLGLPCRGCGSAPLPRTCAGPVCSQPPAPRPPRRCLRTTRARCPLPAARCKQTKCTHRLRLHLSLTYMQQLNFAKKCKYLSIIKFKKGFVIHTSEGRIGDVSFW